MLIAVIADDLTGAADAGVQLVSAGYRTAVVFGEAEVVADDLDAVSFDTDSRAMNALRREACGHGAGVGVEGYSVEIVGDYFGFAKDHGCPATGADELDASVRRAGQIVGNYSDQHVSTLRLR